MHSSLTIYNVAVKSFINTDFEIIKLDGNCSFSEGAVWNNEGFYLFSDIPKNVICRIDETGKKTTYLEESGCTLADREALSQQPGSNGLAYDRDGTLFICQHGNGAVATYKDGELKTFLQGSGVHPFNSPNDIVVGSNGDVFFSDPPYGLKDQKLNPSLRQDIAAFYCWRNGSLIPFSNKFNYPNGICFSPGEKTVYCCSTKSWENHVLEYDARSLAFIRIVAREVSDGIKCDPYGNIYLCTGEGIVIINARGERLALIQFPAIPANCCWGGDSGTDLFVTARENIFLVKGLMKNNR